jgi:lipoprotein-anchoring transpeptidase ErfK/SrfK
MAVLQSDGWVMRRMFAGGGAMGRRATWIVLLALLLAPMVGGRAVAPVFAQDSAPGEVVVPDDATPPADGSDTVEDGTPAADATETPTAEATATETATSEPTATPTDGAQASEDQVTPDSGTPDSGTPDTATQDSATPDTDPTPTVTVDDIKVTINCTANPERIRVTNNGAASIVVDSIGTLYDPLPQEPIAVGKTIQAGGTRQWLAGSTATGNYVLIYRLILTNSAYDQEGVVVHTSVGDVEVRCPAKPATPPVTKDQVAVTINCTSDPEKIRVTNKGKSSLVVNSITTLYDPTSNEPFAVNKTIPAGGTRLWTAGAGATGSFALTNDFILTNTAYDKEGVKVVTSAGTITVKCPKAPPDPFGGAKWIEVNLSTQYLIAWQNGQRVNETYVSTGRPGFETPTGTWYVNTKLLSQTMSGCIQGECYYVPDVPWVMYFTDWGHALHGTYWHNNFGHPMSHGCVNLPLDFAEWLYYWTPIGTPVVIHY